VTDPEQHLAALHVLGFLCGAAETDVELREYLIAALTSAQQHLGLPERYGRMLAELKNGDNETLSAG